MISARLVELIQNHAPQLTSDTVDDLLTNERTHSFRKVPRLEIESRIFRIFNHLGDCIAAGQTFAEDEFEEWGRRRFGQGIPLSEIVYTVILVKAHLSRYIRDHGLIDAAFPRTEADYVLPMPESGKLSVYFQRTDGSLASPRTFPSLAGVSDIAVADWEQDGRPEIFLSSADERQVAVARFDEKERLPFPTLIPLDGKPLALAVGCCVPEKSPRSPRSWIRTAGGFS